MELVLESVGSDYPGLVREALTKKSSSSCSGSISSCGYAWLIVDRDLYVWKYDTEEDSADGPLVFNLPPSGLPYSAQTVSIYRRQGFSAPGIIAVSPEGIVRHWSLPERQPTDCTVNLEREVVLSVTRINIESSEDIHFVLATTTCSFFLLSTSSSIFPTPGKRQRLSSEIIVKTIFANTRTGISAKLVSAIFGEGKQFRLRLVRALIYQQSHDEDSDSSSNTSNSITTDSMHVLAVTEYQLHSYSIKNSAKSWSCKTADLASQHFAVNLWPEHDVDGHSEWQEKVNLWILDAVNIRDGVLILFACINRNISTKVYFAFGYISSYDSTHSPTALEWFCILESLSNDFQSVEADAEINVELSLPSIPEQLFDDRLECVLVITPKAVHSFGLPDRMVKNTPLKLAVCVPVNATIISSGRDAFHCYIFLKERGLQRVRLLPRGFDGNLAPTIAQMSEMQIHSENFPSTTTDRHVLALAFYLFSKADLHKAATVMKELLENRHAGIAQICVEYAIELVDSVPIDKRWTGAGYSSLLASAVASELSSGSSLLLEVHLEGQKKRVLTMFVLFIKSVGLEDKLNRTVHTYLCHYRSARSLIVELIEKIDIASALYKWNKKNSSSIFEAAVNRVLLKRKKRIGEEQLLTKKDYFFQEISRIRDIFDEILEEEESILECNQAIDYKRECIEHVGMILKIILETINEQRTVSILDIEDDLRWTQEKRALEPFSRHLSILLQFMNQIGKDFPNYGTLLRQAVAIASFILNEQKPDDRQDSPIISKLLEISERSTALELAERFQDYKTVVRLACALPDAERRTKIQEYKEIFNSINFLNTLFEYYLENGYLRDLLEMKGPEVDSFFATHTNVGWIRDLEYGDFTKACRSLISLSQKANDDVVRKRRLLSFAKLSALCDDEVNQDYVEGIKNDLRLIKHQQKINPDLEMQLCSSDVTPKVKACTAEEIVLTLLNDPSCSVKQCFDALVTLSTVMREESSSEISGLVNSLRMKVWLTAFRMNSDYWQKVRCDDDLRSSTVYEELLEMITSCAEIKSQQKLKLIPEAEELMVFLPELADNKFITVLLQTAEETARRKILSILNTEVVE
ncbi:unnamed protein product [Thelazia callipaeda]|uniref:Nucleoporin_N domain-containing protein n=1 Tax=Thelazia callipaeda TaxID=103827 RepID=A0A0N5CQX4_THECL|nr:unnamed protein product [Thelazia callipaeda]